MKALLFIFISLTFLYAQDMDALLSSYATESELSKKTKDESAGNLIVYTRDDLERMQVETLQDILKSLRFFTYTENRMSQTDLLNADPLTYNSKSVRVYLNENELLTALTGSGLILFGNMEMDFIDHIEIYEGFPSFDFGVEPATVVIRLYTKTAKHDEGGRVKATIGSYGANKQNIYYTNKENDLSYFFYANRFYNKQDTYDKDNETLRRDKRTERFYGSIQNNQHRFEFHLQQVKADVFLGSLVGNVPESTSVKSSFINIATNSKFLNDTLILNLSYINAQNDFEYKYNNPAFVPDPINPPPSVIPVTYLGQNIEEEALTASLKKIWNLDEHTLSVGIQYRYKYFDLTDVTFNFPIPPIIQAYDTENVYSFFMQDLISINENNMITLSVMNQIYERGSNIDEQNTLQLRLGYIYTNEKFVSKTFISSQEFASEPYMTISPHYGNPDLDTEKYKSIFQELSYKTPALLTKLVLGYGVNEKMPIIDQASYKVVNSNKDVEGYLAALEFTIFFSKKDKLELQANYSNFESPMGISNIEHNNYVIRMLNTLSGFDIYNELDINDGYDGVSTGYNYSAGVKYEVNKDLHINFKGNNIFDTALETRYLNKIMPTRDYVKVPRIERNFMFGLEYLF